MVARIRARLSYGNVVATLALFIALGGTSYAALKLPRNSVGNAQIRNDAVTSAKVQNGSLLLEDFSAAQQAALHGAPGAPGSQGALGPQGPKGDVGPQGLPGAPGATNVVVHTKDLGPLAAKATATATVTCSAGEHAITGGASSPQDLLTIRQSFPLGVAPSPAVEGESPTGWSTVVINTSATNPAQVFGYVVCAKP
jgi:hypothetical protein